MRHFGGDAGEHRFGRGGGIIGRTRRRAGLIGFGSIAEHGHLPAWNLLDEVEVVAVADVAASRLDQARGLLPGATLYQSPSDLLQHERLDIVDICSPPSTHADLIVEACSRAIPDIVCEKPLVLTEEEFVQIVSAKERSASHIVSVNNWFYSDLNWQITHVLKRGDIGDVRRVELRTGRRDIALGDSGWMPRWRTDVASAGGGILLDHGWHQLYLLLGWVNAPVESVRAVTKTVDGSHYPVEDDAAIDLHFPHAEGRVELSWTAENRRNDGRVGGTLGSIAIHDDRIVVESERGSQELMFGGKVTESSYHPDWFLKLFQYNVLSVSKKAAERNFAQAGMLVGTICAAYASAKDGGAPRRPTFPSEEAVGEWLAKRAKSRNDGDSVRSDQA